jgi:excinuclease ABC subunit B
MKFELHSPYKPAGDQPQAIEKLTNGGKFQTLLGITGSGKSFTAASVIENLNKPTLVLAPNKSLAAQLASEFRNFFPKNRVEYFVSYYDYYQPEAYVASSDTYIEKDSSINGEIERLRHSTTTSLLTRPDTLVVASVSAIYGLGSPIEYAKHILQLQVGVEVELRKLLGKLVEMQYDRNDLVLARNSFRVKGDTLDIYPPNLEKVLRVQFFGDEIESLAYFDPVTGNTLEELKEATIWAATHYAIDHTKIFPITKRIEVELDACLKHLKSENKILEAQRLETRTRNDIETLQQLGTCPGVENYSVYMDGREFGEKPYTLLDYFPDDFLCIIDESHVAIPQMRGQYAGDKSRKDNLVEHGFRLPSALDNRPLRFDEIIPKLPQIICLSATPSDYEIEHSSQVVEQIIRPTGLLDPEVEVRPTKGQVDDLMEEIHKRVAKNERVLVTTLTKKMSEDLTEYLYENGINVRYLHSDIDTIERVELLRALRLGEFDVLIGINLLREGLDLPEVSLVTILDADKEGFLRSKTALVQTIGRAARNEKGKVIMYGDRITASMQYALDETQRRREVQQKHNEKYGISPIGIKKDVDDILSMLDRPSAAKDKEKDKLEGLREKLSDDFNGDLTRLLAELEIEMEQAAQDLRFEEAASIRDEIRILKAQVKDYE